LSVATLRVALARATDLNDLTADLTKATLLARLTALAERGGGALT
jgi:hypothetical protein